MLCLRLMLCARITVLTLVRRSIAAVAVAVAVAITISAAVEMA